MKKWIYVNSDTRPASFNAMLALLLNLCLLVVSAPPARGQNASPELRRTQLLNNLNVLYYSQPSSQNVLLKLRIHTGASFDLVGKEGTLVLLGDALFPDDTTREYFTNELGGRLEVETTYDSITLTLEGKASEYERIVESLRNALINTSLSAEIVARLRERRIKQAKERDAAASGAADRAALRRLFGAYPYGRIAAGISESLARVERADLMLARERFLNSDNAALVVAGPVDYNRVMRALRQQLGGWRKGDRTFPPTFRQPDAPDARTLLVDFSANNSSNNFPVEVRLALRGVARSDRDAAAAKLLALVARERWLKSFGATANESFKASHDSYALGGVFMMSATVSDAAAAKRAIDAGRAALKELMTAPLSAAELARAKSDAMATVNPQASTLDSLALRWLDAETYKSASANETSSMETLTAADVQRVAGKLFRDEKLVTIAVGDAQQLRAALPDAVQESKAAATPQNPPRPRP
ncbi:MAG: insulinase family protein [Pyrinomonadaceae bacterium]|nr:insulinase family protein [Pyrinomonadaceae bacterium]